MPRYCIPLTGTTIYYPPADAGRHRIDARLHVTEPHSSSGINIELSFKREPFRRTFQHSKTWAYLHSLGRRDELKNPPLNEEEQHIWERAKPQLVYVTLD